MMTQTEQNTTASTTGTDVITQPELQEAFDLRTTANAAIAAAHRACARLEARRENGARIEPGRLRLDRASGWVTEG
jgi:hypothetical protein